MPFSRTKRLPFNGWKRLALSLLERAYPGGLRADLLAWKTGVTPKRAVYSRLNRLARWGLVRIRRNHQGLLVYSITPRGRRRLVWLRRSCRA